MRRRHLLASLGVAATGGVAGCSESSDRATPVFRVSAPEFDAEDSLPTRFTCDGAGISVPFDIENAPAPTESFAVVASYNQGPFSDPVFWTLWNVSLETDQIPEGLPQRETIESLGGARQGRQPGAAVGYVPPCPPKNEPFTYHYQVYALGDTLDIDGGAEHDTASEAINAAGIASRRFSIEHTR